MKAKIDIEGKKSELNNQKNNLQNIDNYVWNKYQQIRLHLKRKLKS